MVAPVLLAPALPAAKVATGWAARRLALMIAKRGAQQFLKKKGTQIVGSGLFRSAKLQGIKSSRGFSQSLLKSGKEREIGRILSKTNLPRRPPGKNIFEVSKNIKGKVQGQNPFKLEPYRVKGRLYGKQLKAYNKLGKVGKLKYDIANNRIIRDAAGRNALKIGARQVLPIVGIQKAANVVTGKTKTNRLIEEAKKARQQELEAQVLLETLTEKEKLEAEQELESVRAERVVAGKPETTSINDVKKVVGNKVSEQPVERVIPGTNIPSMKISDDKGRAEWLAKTANSPAALAGFTDDERWALQKSHRAWKKNRKRK